MYSSYSAAALALRAAKPSSSYAHSTYHQYHHGDGECHLQQELHPLNPRVAPRFMLDGYLLRHSAHLLLLSARLRPPPPPHPPPHCCRRRVAARCCGGGRSVVGPVSWRLDPRGCRCSGHGGAGRLSDLAAVRRRLEARECRCGGGGGRLDVGARCGRRGAPRLVGRAVWQEVWEYEGGEWPRTSCSTECHTDWEEEEEEEDCGLLAQWEVPRRFRLSTRRWEEDDGDRCRDCHRRKGEESDYHDEDEHGGRRRERRNMNERHGRFRDSDQRRWEQRDHHDDEDDYLEFRRWKEWRERRDRRDSEFDDSVARRGAEARRYSEDDRKYDQRRTKRDFGYEDAVDVRREGAGRYTENNQRSDWRTEKREYEVDDEVDVRREGRHHTNNNQRYVKRQQHITDDREEEDVSLLESRRWHDEEDEYDDWDIADRRYYSGRRSQKSARASALHEDESNRASTSRNTVDMRVARNEENSSSRVRWHDNVDRRAEQTYEDRDQRYSSSVSRSYDEKHDFNHDNARLVRVRDSRIGTRDVRVITEDDTNLASSSKNTTISKHHSTVDQKSTAQKDDSRKSSQKIMELSEVRGTNTEHDSRTQSYHQEDRGRYIDNRSSSLQSSAKMASDTRTQLDQHYKVDQQVVALTDSRRRSEKLTDIKMDSSRDVSRTSLSQRNHDEVNQTDIDDRATSVHNITHITRDKKRYVNQQVIHETDIDVQNVAHVDVSKVCASDITTSRNSQNHLETRSDVTNNQLVQIHANSSPMIRSPQSNLEAGLHNQVYLTSATNFVNTTVEKDEQVEFTKASTNNTAIASPSESHMQTRIDDQLQSRLAVNTVGSVQEQIDLTKILTSDSTVSSSSQGLDARGNQVSITSATNFVDRTRESPDKSDQEMAQVSNIEANDQVRSKFDESSQDSRERLGRLKETGRLMQHNMGLNWQQEGSSRISDDTDIATLEIQSTEDGSSMVTADMQKRPMIMGNSEQEVRSGTTGGTSIPTGSSARHPVNESLLESATRLEKSSTFHVGQFVREVRKGVSDADTTLTRKNDKPIMGGITRSSSRSRMRGPSDEMWDVQSATSQETFKTADKEEGSSVDGGTTSTSQTPMNETALARKVHKSLWAYVADIIRLGWIQRGESHDSNSNRSVKKSSSSNSWNTEGCLSSQERDNEGIQKKNESSRPQDQYLMKSHAGESLKNESLSTGSQGLHTSEASYVPHIGTSKGDFVSRISKDDAHMIGEKTKQSDVAASQKQDIVGVFSEDNTPTLVDITLGHFPEHEAATSSMIMTKGSADGDTGKEVIAGISSMPISTEGVGWTSGSNDRIYDPSGATTPYRHPHTQLMSPHEDTSAVILESPELPTGGSMRFDEKIVLQDAPEVIRTEGKDAELKRRNFQRNKQVMKETFDEWEEAYQRDAEQRMTDELFMREALHEAQRAADIWEVPVGAVLVQNGEIIARGCNLVEDLRDSTAHAEIVCIREASNKLKTWRLADTTLYVTLEPCAMCAGAILQARVDTVVWGAPNKLLGADGSWVRLFPGDGQTGTLDSANPNQAAGPVHPFHPKISIRRGVLSTECSEIMQQFFHLRRKKKQKPESPPHAHLPGRNHPVKFFSKMHHMFGTIFCM